MAKFFTDRGDAETAALFRPSSMEAVRSIGGDTLTLVSEVPLFVLPGVGLQIEPKDPKAEEWRARIEQWRIQVGDDEAAAHVREDVADSDMQPVAIREQMHMQWAMIRAGVEQIAAASE
jgi:hypothetical protein